VVDLPGLEGVTHRTVQARGSSFHAGLRASGNSSTAVTVPTRMSTSANCSNSI